MNIVAIVRQKSQQHARKLELAVGGVVSMGRAWQNDIVIDDDYVDGKHVLLTLDEVGNIFIEDTGSQNGTQVNGKVVNGKTPYQFGSTITVGDATVTIVDPDAEVAPAIKRDRVHVLTRRLDSVAGFAIATLLAFASQLIDIYLLTGTEATSDRLSNAFLGLGAVIFVWCLVAGLFGKVFRHKMNFSLHWIFNCLLVTGMLCGHFVLELVRFNLNSELADQWSNMFLFTIALFVFVYGTLSLSTRVSKFGKLAAACILASLPLLHSVVTPMFQDDHRKWSRTPTVNKQNFPPAFLLAKPTTLEEHMSTTDEIFSRLESEVEN